MPQDPTIATQKQIQKLSAHVDDLLARIKNEVLPSARELEKSTREAAHDLERATVALERDEEALVQQAKQALRQLVANRK